MSDRRNTAARVAQDVERLIDVAFYEREAGITFSSISEASRHFVSTGQAQNLSPSPFILWNWIRSQGPSLPDFGEFLSDPTRICAHPAFRPDLYFDLCRTVGGDLAEIATVLSRLDNDHAPLLPGFAEAARARGDRNLLGFLTVLSARRLQGAGLEMALFSTSWYLDAYEDVALAGVNPFSHYVASGWKEGRDPSPNFSTARYLERHLDVSRSGLNPLIHYLDVGEAQTRTIERSAAYSDIVRHAFKRGRLPAEYMPFESDDTEVIQNLCAELDGVRLVIVVPFFQNEDLVDVVCQSLAACSEELIAHRACVLLVNDSPEHVPLRERLQCWADRLSGNGFDVALFEAQRNSGFIHSTNVGLRCSELLSCACLMLNSDTRLQPGSLTEMLEVAALDDRFAFVSPLSNNATIATLGLDSTADAVAAASHHAAIAQALPRYLVVPVCVGFCLLVRPEIVKLFGYLDPAYGHGYNEENDYIMRANRKGYLSVLATRAFVSHIGEQSFSATEASANRRDELNRRILLERYPEFEAAVARYFASPEAQVRRAVERYAISTDIVIDLSGMSGVANGTSVLAREMIPRLIRSLGVERCAIRGSADHLRWLGLADIDGIQHWEPADQRYAKIGLRLSQPYSREEVEFLSSHAAKVVFFMLDTISDDCLYLHDVEVRGLWEWVCEHADGLIYNSPYSLSKYQKRFDIDPDVIQHASYHSLDVGEYRNRPGTSEDRAVPFNKPFMLIVGNYFQHKAIGMAVDATDVLLLPRVLVGAKLQRLNLTSFDSGRLNKGELALLYEKAAVILFPSLYEGFGFPLMEGIAAGKPVIAYRSDLTLDIARRIGAPSNLFLFEAFADIPRMVEQALNLVRTPTELPRRGEDGWQRSIEEIVATLEAVQVKPLNYRRIVKRQKALSRLS